MNYVLHAPPLFVPTVPRTPVLKRGLLYSTSSITVAFFEPAPLIWPLFLFTHFEMTDAADTVPIDAVSIELVDGDL